MAGYFKILFISLFAALICGLNLSPALSQEERVVIVNETRGQISSIDQQNAMLIVRQFKDEKYEDVTIYVDKKTTIEKGYETVDFAKLAIGDKTEVEYTADDKGKNIATYIWIESEE